MADRDIKSDEPSNYGVPRLRLFAKASDIGQEDKRRTKFELFFDLWFVANIQIVLEVKTSNNAKSNENADPGDIRRYLGFLSILWFTWFIVCMFDVRFITDSIFERVIRIIQFGSMVGFTVGTYSFEPEKEFCRPDRKPCPADDDETEGDRQRILFQNLSQYCSIFWIHFKDTRRVGHRTVRSEPDKRPILAAAGIHFVAAMVYLGIASKFKNQTDHISRVYLIWYIGSAIEAILQLALAYKCEVLTFRKTKLTERLAVFTVFVLGEAVNGVTKTILIVSENGKDWNLELRGIFVAAVATTYFLYLLYFDWLDHQNLSGFRQLLYSLLHFPFHAALLLFGAGSTLFMKWWQAQHAMIQYGVEMRDIVLDQFLSDSSPGVNKSAAVADGLNGLIDKLDSKYPIKDHNIWDNLHAAVEMTRSINNCYWDLDSNCTDTKGTWANSSWIYELGLYNSILTTFEIAPEGDKELTRPNVTKPDPADTEYDDFGESSVRVDTTFQYYFACSGLVLLLMVVFHVLTLTKSRWAPFDYLRVGLFAAVGLAVGLIPIMSTVRYHDHAVDYEFSPWILPTTCLAVFGVLVLTHVHRPPARLVQWMSRPRRPRFPWKSWPSGNGRRDINEEVNLGNERDDGRASRNYDSLPSLERNGRR
ncbi:hypothetical protein PG984_016124 [Apiospora sp. TS-2023a]